MKRLISILLLALLPGLAPALVIFQENFDSGALNPHLGVSASPGFSYDLSGGTLNLHMATGSGKGSIGVSTDFQVVGDFTATVDVSLGSLYNALGIGAYRSGGGGGNVFYWGGGSVISNMFTPIQIPQLIPSPGPNATFRIRRTGTTLFGEILNGTTWQVINSATSAIFADPLTITLFLDNETGPITAQNGSFDNLRIQAAGFRNFVPAPATWALTLLGLALLTRRSRLPG